MSPRSFRRRKRPPPWAAAFVTQLKTPIVELDGIGYPTSDHRLVWVDLRP